MMPCVVVIQHCISARFDPLIQSPCVPFDVIKQEIPRCASTYPDAHQLTFFNLKALCNGMGAGRARRSAQSEKRQHNANDDN